MRYAPRRAHVPYWWMLATAAAALIAIVPVAAAVFVTVTGGTTATAFAAAPGGDYAVVVRPEESADVVVAVPAAGGVTAEIARIERLPGYTSYGAVSPDGARVALVTANGGTQSRPVAALLVIELDTGDVTRLAEGVDYLQTPVWAPDSSAVVVTRTAGADTPAADVDVLRVALDGSGERVMAQARGVLGAYPAGFDGEGRLVHVVIEARGSVAYRDGAEVAVLAAGITRDWRLSPDGMAMAFIETITDGGVRYHARTVSLDGGALGTMALTADTESLGVAWRPGSDSATFGMEPGAGSGQNAFGQAAPGFDIPLAYSVDGQLLAVQRWTGTSFDAPGEASLEIVGPDGARTALEGYGRFYGWATK